MAFHHVDSLDDNPPPGLEDPKNLASATLVLPCSNDDDVVLPNFELDSHGQRTSGASETIFMKFFARSSRATGPKMRVPIGSPSLSTSTAELLSNRM